MPNDTQRLAEDIAREAVDQLLYARDAMFEFAHSLGVLAGKRLEEIWGDNDAE